MSHKGVFLPCSIKQIPFTVPSNFGQKERRHEANKDGDKIDDLGYPLKRPSVEIQGAYGLGSIDPSLYNISGEDDEYLVEDNHIGRVWFAVQYEVESEKLLVTLIKAKNLPSRISGNVNGCDPFVRIYLMPDERRYMQSRFKKKTCNPKFEETYVYQVSSKSVRDRTLKLTVFDVDRHRRHNIIGHAIFALSCHDCLSNDRTVVWRDLEKELNDATPSKGEILLSLTYNNNFERITVSIFEGRAIKPADSTCPSIDLCVKVSLLIQNKVIKTKKTDTVKKSCDPAFNESFNFKLPQTSLDTTSISIAVLQNISGYRERVIGRIVFGSFMFARGKELDHWNEMLANQREQVSGWHFVV